MLIYWLCVFALVKWLWIWRIKVIVNIHLMSNHWFLLRGRVYPVSKCTGFTLIEWFTTGIKISGKSIIF